MQSVIIVIHLMIVLAMVGLILLQKSEGGGLGMGGSGGGGGFMSNRGTTNVLSRTTAFLAATFFATSLVLSIIASLDRKPRSVLDPSGRPSPSAPVTPGAPLGGPGGGVLDQLRGPPQTPAEPQVPRSQ